LIIDDDPAAINEQEEEEEEEAIEGEQAEDVVMENVGEVAGAEEYGTYSSPLTGYPWLSNRGSRTERLETGLICQYEIPGGGVCRDSGCRDVHLSAGRGGLGR